MSPLKSVNDPSNDQSFLEGYPNPLKVVVITIILFWYYSLWLHHDR